MRAKVRVPDHLKVKWPGDTLNEGFVPLPKRLMRCMDKVFEGEHAINDLRVVLAIVDFTRLNQTRQPSYQFLAFTTGMSPRKFKERVEAMRQKNWLDVSGTDDAVRITIHGLCNYIERLTPDDDVEEVGEMPF